MSVCTIGEASQPVLCCPSAWLIRFCPSSFTYFFINLAIADTFYQVVSGWFGMFISRMLGWIFRGKMLIMNYISWQHFSFVCILFGFGFLFCLYQYFPYFSQYFPYLSQFDFLVRCDLFTLPVQYLAYLQRSQRLGGVFTFVNVVSWYHITCVQNQESREGRCMFFWGLP